MIKKIFKKNFLLFLILLTSLLIRIVGTSPGYLPYHSDEPMSYSSAIKMIINGNLNPGRYDYAAGVPLVHYFFYKIFFLPLALLRLFFPHPRVFLTAIKIGNRFLAEFREPIFGSREINALFWSRYITAFLGTGTVFLTYLLAKRLFNKTTGLVAAFLLAFNYRHVLSSHFALSNIPNCFFALLTVFAATLLLEKNTRRRYLLAGLCVSLSFSIKYQIFSFFPFLFVHLLHWLQVPIAISGRRSRRKSGVAQPRMKPKASIWVWRRKSFKEFFNPNFLLALFLIPIVFALLNPYLLLHLKEAVPIIHYVSLRYAMGIKRFNFYPLFYLYHWGIGKLPSLAIIFGLILALVLRPLKAMLLLAFIVPFTYIFIYYSIGGLFPRNFVVVMPYLLILAGFGIAQFFYLFERWFKKGLLFKALLISLLLLINFYPIKDSVILSYYYAQSWNFERLAYWLTKEIPRGVKIRAYPLMIDFYAKKALIDKEIEISRWNYSKGPNSLAEFQAEGTDFAILNTENFQSISYWWRGWPNYRSFLKYGGVPFDFIQSSFYGLAVEELLHYTVHEVYKPWQAYEHNFLVFKIPPKPKELGKKIASFSFDEPEKMWSLRGDFGFGSPQFTWESQEGRNKLGALAILKGGGADTARLASPLIPVIPGKLYTARGWIRNDFKDEEAREGFLRVDFFEDHNREKSQKLGKIVAISARAAATGDWVQVAANLVAPDKVQYLTVSFQIKESMRKFTSYLDDVEVFETETIPEEKFKEIPYIKPTIPLESVYYNAFI